MKAITFTLETGKEVPASLNGIVVNGSIPENPTEALQVCGGDKSIMTSVFNEGYVLNHFQKQAKRAAAMAAKKGLTGDDATKFIQDAVNAHKPGVRTIRDGSTRKTSERKQTIDAMRQDLAKLPPELQAAWSARLDALTPKRKSAKAVENGQSESAKTPVNG